MVVVVVVGGLDSFEFWAWQKRGGGVFEAGGLIPQCILCVAVAESQRMHLLFLKDMLFRMFLALLR